MRLPNTKFLYGLFTFVIGILLLKIIFAPPIPASVIAPMPVQRADFRFENTERDTDLQKATDALLPLFDRMPTVPVYVVDAPILKSGTNVETSNAYTDCDQNRFPFIFVKKNYRQTAHETRLTNTLKHELTHAWLCRQGMMSAGHDAIFRRKLNEVGGWISLPKD